VGLDLASRADIVRIVRNLVRDEGLSVLWATHIFDEVEEDDSVYVLHHGKIIMQGRAGDIAGQAGHVTLADAFRALTEDANQETSR
jgi:ABC-2 type transport system ATP-binding protein